MDRLEGHRGTDKHREVGHRGMDVQKAEGKVTEVQSAARRMGRDAERRRVVEGARHTGLQHADKRIEQAER